MNKMLLKYIYGAHLYFVFGIFIGITLCLIFSYTDCDFENNYGNNQIEKNDDEYEPVINLAGKPMKAHKTPQSIIRPRYYSTELGIRAKLFVGVLTNKKNILKTGIGFNRTVGHLVDKLMFFIESVGSEKLNISLPGVVGFTDTRTILRPFHTIKYITDTFLEEYDYFFLVSDASYINARKLKDIANKISVSQNIHLGSILKEDNSIYCSLDAGLLLSNSVLKKIKYNLDWCVKHAYSDNDSDNLGRCILHSTELPCKNTVQGQIFGSFQIKSETFLEKELETFSEQQIINFSSFFPLHNPILFYKLHSFISENYILEKQNQIKLLRESIILESKKTPYPNESLTWPLGNRPGTKPANRFDVIRWDYFTEKYIYLTNDFNTMKELEGSEKLDIQYILDTTIKTVTSKYKNKLIFIKLINGYKRFDPARGMEYKLDIAFKDIESGLEIHKRMEVCKPLGTVELIPMPYVTENTRINILLPIRPSQIEEAKIFIDNYSKICMEKHEKTFLILVLIYSLFSPGKETSNDIYFEIKNMANSLSNKHKKDGGKILWVSIRLPEDLSEDEPIVDFLITDLGTKKLPPDTLILFCQVNMEIRLDFLNRVRMNTILRHQVYAPIPFSEFNPEIVYNNDLIRPQQLDINKNYGHYLSDYTNIISFYLNDYLTARKNIQNIIPLIQSDREIPLMISSAFSKKNTYLENTLYSLFIKKSDTHILRAVDPGLRLRYMFSNCNIKDENFRKTCQNFQALNQGTRSQLAKIILSYFKN